MKIWAERGPALGLARSVRRQDPARAAPACREKTCYLLLFLLEPRYSAWLGFIWFARLSRSALLEPRYSAWLGFIWFARLSRLALPPFPSSLGMSTVLHTSI